MLLIFDIFYILEWYLCEQSEHGSNIVFPLYALFLFLKIISLLTSYTKKCDFH